MIQWKQKRHPQDAVLKQSRKTTPVPKKPRDVKVLNDIAYMLRVSIPKFDTLAATRWTG